MVLPTHKINAHAKLLTTMEKFYVSTACFSLHVPRRERKKKNKVMLKRC